MKYKLIAADIDGTLLNSNKELTQITKNAILRAQKEGIYFTLSTGRPIMGIRQFGDILSPNIPVITYNGAMVLRFETEEIISSCLLPEEAAWNIYQRGLEFNTTVVAWVHNHLYCNRIDERVLKYRTITMETPHLIEDFSSLATQTTKMLWIDDPEKNIEYMEALKGTLPSVNYSTSAPILLEFMSHEVSKATALSHVASFLHLTMDQVIAIGDGLNDLPMISAAGMGVAMANGHQKTKEAANFITRSNDEDGVAYMINTLLEKGDLV